MYKPSILVNSSRGTARNLTFTPHLLDMPWQARFGHKPHLLRTGGPGFQVLPWLVFRSFPQSAPKHIGFAAGSAMRSERWREETDAGR
jgi:hypothetical protein